MTQDAPPQVYNTVGYLVQFIPHVDFVVAKCKEIKSSTALDTHYRKVLNF